MMTKTKDLLTIAYMNIKGQTGLDIVKQVQIEHFMKHYDIDILHCQEVNIDGDSFSVRSLNVYQKNWNAL